METINYDFVLSITPLSNGNKNSDKSFNIDTDIKKPRLNIEKVIPSKIEEKNKKDFSNLPETLYNGYKLLEKSFVGIMQGILDKHKNESYKVKLDPTIAADMIKLFGEIKEELTFDDYFYLMRTAQNIGKELATRGTK